MWLEKLAGLGPLGMDLSREAQAGRAERPVPQRGAGGRDVQSKEAAGGLVRGRGDHSSPGLSTVG